MAALAFFPPAAASAQETTTYTYDALNRLVTASKSGGPTDGEAHTIGYDPAGNRTNYAVTGVVSANLAISGTSVTEGGTLVFTVTRSGNTAIPANASYSTGGGTATPGIDFTPASGIVSFAAGQTTATLSVVTIDDTEIESAETLIVTLSNPSASTTLTAAAATGTINDNDVAPANLAIGNASVTEGGALVFTVTRTGNTAIAASASYATFGGTANSGSDFTGTSGTVSFAAGQTTATISVATIDDTQVESAETLTVTLSNPSANTTITTPTATGTINDNDIAPANLAISDALANEGGTLVFTVTRSGNTAIAASANYTTANGTALAGSDFAASSGTVSFAAGQTTATISIATIDDSMVESAETMTVTLSNPSANAAITTATATGTINDDDVAPAILAIENASTTEGGTLTFTVRRTGNYTIPASATYTTASGSATAGSDFPPVSGTINLIAYQTAANISIATSDDSEVEPPETMTVTLSNPANYTTIATATATGTINDNDVAPVYLSMGNATVTEGGNLVFTVTRTGNTAVATTASYTTSGGTATSGSDFTAVSGTVSFAAGQTTATISIPTIDDALVESSETMTVTLSNPGAYTSISGASGTGTITDNDVGPPTISISDAPSVKEGGGLLFTVSLSRAYTSAISVNYATADGTAGAGTDFIAQSGTITFQVGQTTATIVITTKTDPLIDEGTEYMYVNLSGATSGAAILDPQGKGSILDVTNCRSC
ncbi:Calx-beta domain-containing protein [Novosphingobium sp. PhB165]|nr:Calx-beta domain-containing protein [Novosphingobium sp. PhB165]